MTGKAQGVLVVLYGLALASCAQPSRCYTSFQDGSGQRHIWLVRNGAGQPICPGLTDEWSTRP